MIYKQRLFTVLLGLLFAAVLTDQASALYDPGVGRFCSRDPIGYEDGELVYSINVSLSKVDPTGLYDWYPLGPGALPPPCDPCKDVKNMLFDKYPKFKKLFDCSIRQNCLRPTSFKCKWDCGPGMIAGYVPPYLYLRGYIYICYDALKNKHELPETLLEEAYHALTICDRGTKLGGSLESLENLLTNSSLTISLQSCGNCLGREILAKSCAKRNVSTELSINTVIQAFSSCNNCDPAFVNSAGDYLDSPLGRILRTWWKRGDVIRDCDRIDRDCGAT